MRSACTLTSFTKAKRGRGTYDAKQNPFKIQFKFCSWTSRMTVLLYKKQNPQESFSSHVTNIYQ